MVHRGLWRRGVAEQRIDELRETLLNVEPEFQSRFIRLPDRGISTMNVAETTAGHSGPPLARGHFHPPTRPELASDFKAKRGFMARSDRGRI